MKIAVRMFEPVRLQTRDAMIQYSETLDQNEELGGVLADMEAALGMLEPGDLSRIKSILAKYVGGGDTTATGVTTPISDAARDFGRTQAAKVRANIENHHAINKIRSDFWDKRNSELAASIKR